VIARFDQAKVVSDEERKEAFSQREGYSEKSGVEMRETEWKQLGSKPHTSNPAHKKAS
jgi:hypothetical protein